MNTRLFSYYCLCLIVLLVTACGGSSSGNKTATAAVTADSTATETDNLPAMSLWRSNMLTAGERFCNKDEISSLSTWEGSVWYYDGVRVYYQIYEYTGDPRWKQCASYVADVYRTYVLNNDGQIGAWRVFPHGLREDYLHTGNEDSRNALILLAENTPYAAQGGAEAIELSRETAYLIHAYLLAEEVTGSTEPKLMKAYANALGHVDRWFVSEDAAYVNPFMAALTAEALIAYSDAKGDPGAKAAVNIIADWLWDNAWDAGSQSFPYVICRERGNPRCAGEEENGVDLNLLISPLYAWLYKETGDARYAVRADAIFQSGVRNAWLGSGKQFSQNYRWSFEHVKWRSQR